MPHDEAAGIRPRGELVVLAAIDLHLVFIEAVIQIARRGRDRRVEALRVVDGERAIRQVGGHRLRHRRRHAGLRQTVPHLRQRGERRAVAVDLGGARGRHVLQTVGAREVAVQIVEAAILRVDHHDRLDRRDVRLRGDVVAAARIQAQCCCDRDRRRADQFFVHLVCVLSLALGMGRVPCLHVWPRAKV